MPHQQPISLRCLMCLAIAFALLFLLLVSYTTWAYAQTTEQHHNFHTLETTNARRLRGNHGEN
jgi:predicted small integral membrane protein